MVNSIKPGSIPGYPAAGQAARAATTQAPSTAMTGRAAAEADRFELTPQARAVSEAAAQTEVAPLNQAKIQALQQQIASGQYQVDAHSIASRLSQLDRALGGE